jgi:hypothetical protein
MLDANHRGDVDASLDALQRIYDDAVCAGGALSARPAQEERPSSGSSPRWPSSKLMPRAA